MLGTLLALANPPQSLDQKIQVVMPTTQEEKWLSIPWQLDLNVARRMSQEQKKPIFFWIMNGHPMGCT